MTLVSVAAMTGCAYAYADDPRLKRRIMMTAILAAILGAFILLILLAQDSTREFFLQRASATQDYDEGETGRFGNQARSLPMLLDRFWGFGPLRFRLFFGLEAHDSYITAFANDGWLGGLVYVLIAASSVFVALRVMTRPSPFRSDAQIFAPVLISYFALAFVIDIDHWRHFPLLMGAVGAWRRRGRNGRRVQALTCRNALQRLFQLFCVRLDRAPDLEQLAGEGISRRSLTAVNDHGNRSLGALDVDQRRLLPASDARRRPIDDLGLKLLVDAQKFAQDQPPTGLAGALGMQVNFRGFAGNSRLIFSLR